LFIAVLGFLFAMPVVAFDASPAQKLFLENQREFNAAVYAHYSENAQHIGQGGFSRATFAVAEAKQSDLEILAELIRERKIKSQIVCRRLTPTACAEKIINQDPGVMPAIRLLPFIQQAEVMKSMSILNTDVANRWKLQLSQLQLLVRDYLGNDFVEFLIGYNDSINIYHYILVSKDRTKVIIISGDSK
jgi:hypothetical protein